ncbi:MAG TPA: cytochrome b/b6 domain-containing protein [Gammaproteobacteria bacterium]|nr:cytochrome b/b6 domain-containing protein [Gammaproteobacteria bacterium]
MTESNRAGPPGAPTAFRVVRHALVDRVFHWVTAACVLTLLATAFLPILGVKFDWVNIHWITGVVLTIAVLFHIVRGLFWQRIGTVWFGAADVREAAAILSATLRRSGRPPKPGKYSFAQKLVHLFFTLVVLVAIVTGGFMLAHVETPWWRPNAYLLSGASWGVVYVLHDLSALLLVTMVMTHVYFALRPEKLLFTRAMLRGWITRREYEEHHDPTRWQVDR